MSFPDKHAFYISYSTLFLWMLAFLLVCDSILMTLSSFFDGAEIRPFLHFKLFTVLSLINTLFVVWAYKCEITHEGIHSTNFWGKPLYLAWDGIVKARIRRLFGLSFYVLESRDQICLQIPRFLGQQREFELMVQAMIDSDNPLQNCLNRYQLPDPEDNSS